MEQQFDRSDAAVLIGLILIGWSVWLVAGPQGALAYAGAILVLMGTVAAYVRRQRETDAQQATQEQPQPERPGAVFPGKHD